MIMILWIISGWDKVLLREAEYAEYAHFAKYGPKDVRVEDEVLPDEMPWLNSTLYKFHKVNWINTGKLEQLWAMIDSIVTEEEQEFNWAWSQAIEQNEIRDKNTAYLADLAKCTAYQEGGFNTTTQIIHSNVCECSAPGCYERRVITGGSGGSSENSIGNMTMNEYVQHNNRTFRNGGVRGIFG